ncbi:MAG: rhodanese-like domain-containing protein, partial [Pseudomonadota bacterium]
EEFLDELQNARVSLSQPVAVICARGIRSARLTRRLEAAGIGPIVDIPEGMLGSRSGPGWLSRELPVIRVN